MKLMEEALRRHLGLQGAFFYGSSKNICGSTDFHPQLREASTLPR